jgi:DNA-binding transcriptional ArsR family regulator
MAKLSDFMLSRVRVKLIQTFLSDPNQIYYVRELTRITDEEINAVRRELNRLEQAGLLKNESRGNRLYYFPNKNYDFYNELLCLVAKTTNIGRDLRKSRNKLGKIKYAVLSGRFVRNLPHQDSNEVDMLIIGNVILPELSQLVKKEEARRKTEINYTVMTLDEFHFRKQRRDPFLLGILSQSRVMVIGDEEDMVSQKPREENQ